MYASDIVKNAVSAVGGHGFLELPYETNSGREVALISPEQFKSIELLAKGPDPDIAVMNFTFELVAFPYSICRINFNGEICITTSTTDFMNVREFIASLD